MNRLRYPITNKAVVSIITDLNRLENETDFEWELRCCLAKRRKETDMDWVEIRDMLGLDITPDQLRKIAVGYEKYDNYIHDDGVFTANRILSISDAHVPFNLPPEIFKKYKGRVDTLVFNGDTEDCWSCSSFPRKFRIGLDEEMILTRQYIIDVINIINPKKVVILKGNHEHRLGRYLTDKLNEELLSIMPDSPLELIINRGFHVNNRMNHTNTWYASITEMFAESGISVEYTGDWYKMIGRTIFAHPLSYSSGMLKTTEKAVNFFLRENRDFNAICLGHTHKVGSYCQGNIKMYEQGCTCALNRLDYNDGKLVIPGQNGYIYLCHDSDGNIIDDKSKLEIIM